MPLAAMAAIAAASWHLAAVQARIGERRTTASLPARSNRGAAVAAAGAR
jgi:hypothetical protein